MNTVYYTYCIMSLSLPGGLPEYTESMLTLNLIIILCYYNHSEIYF